MMQFKRLIICSSVAVALLGVSATATAQDRPRDQLPQDQQNGDRRDMGNGDNRDVGNGDHRDMQRGDRQDARGSYNRDNNGGDQTRQSDQSYGRNRQGGADGHGWSSHHRHCRTQWYHHRRVTRCDR